MIKIQTPDRIVLSQKKNTVKTFLDMDGVISDWIGSAAKLCDLDLNDKEIREGIKKDNGFVENYVDPDTLWKKIEEAGSDFWENLELFPWSKKLYNAVKGASDEFSILSSPGKFPITASQACAGKVLWLDKHFDNHEDYIFCYQKYRCADENSVLVDDSDYKIEPFQEAGGNGFLWPNPLSLLDGDVDVDETINDLVKLIESLK